MFLLEAKRSIVPDVISEEKSFPPETEAAPQRPCREPGGAAGGAFPWQRWPGVLGRLWCSAWSSHCCACQSGVLNALRAAKRRFIHMPYSFLEPDAFVSLRLGLPSELSLQSLF